MEERRFTLKEYEEYIQAPHWERDGSEERPFASEADYHAYWSQTITEWQAAFKREYKEVQEQWTKAEDYIDRMPEGGLGVFTPENTMAAQRLPYALWGTMRKIAVLWGNYPQPSYHSPGMEWDQYTSAASQCLKQELKQNSFSALGFEMALDMEISFIGVLKTGVDHDQPGPFGKEGRITINKMDPAKMAWDPRAKRLKWSHMGYVMYEDRYDPGEAMRMFPGCVISDDMDEVTQPADDGLFGNNIKTPVPNPMQGNASLRKQVSIIECWFKDEREKFVADMVVVENLPTREIEPSEENGMVSAEANPDYDPEMPEVYSAPKVDEDGYVVGEWVPAYPDGRCIILAGAKRVIQDFANPYEHKQAPFIFFKSRPSKKQVATGDLTNLMIVDMKRNDLLSRYHLMAQQEIERPMLAEQQAFRKPRQWMRMSGQANNVLVVRSIASFMRMQPTEAPQFPMMLLQQYEKAFDMACAISGIMMGDLAEGAQLSAQAVSSLQQFSTGVLKMKAELIAEGMKDLGYQMLWLMRQTYDENIEIPVMNPDGTKQVVKWGDADPASDYIIDIESGTGLPGAENAEGNMGMNLWRENAIDRPKLLQMLRMHDWQQICDRMDKKQEADITAEAAGRAIGITIKEQIKQDGIAGRKRMD